MDDYAKIKKKENAGLTPRQKLVLQILVAAVFILVLFLESDGLPSLMIPFTGISIDLPWPVYIIFAAFVIVGADNAVNLTGRASTASLRASRCRSRYSSRRSARASATPA